MYRTTQVTSVVRHSRRPEYRWSRADAIYFTMPSNRRKQFNPTKSVNIIESDGKCIFWCIMRVIKPRNKDEKWVQIWGPNVDLPATSLSLGQYI